LVVAGGIPVTDMVCRRSSPLPKTQGDRVSATSSDRPVVLNERAERFRLITSGATIGSVEATFAPGRLDVVSRSRIFDRQIETA